jgi:hypothetical protein
MVEIFCGGSKGRRRTRRIKIFLSWAPAYPPQRLGRSPNLLERGDELFRVRHLLFRLKAVKEGIRRGAVKGKYA